MAPRKRFLLRIDERLYAALERWAAQDLRSVNGQIEFLLTEAARRAGRFGGTEPRGLDPADVGGEDAPQNGEGTEPSSPDRSLVLDESGGEV